MALTKVTTNIVKDAAITQSKIASGVATSGPAFYAWMSAQQVLSNSTNTKILYNSKDYDTNGCYDTTSNRFTPNVPGYYQINALLYYASASTGYMRIYLYKNGSAYTQGNMVPFTTQTGQLLCLNQLVYANGVSDYFEIWGWQSSGGNMNTGSTSRLESNWSAFLARTA